MPELSFKDLAGSVQRLSQWSNQPVLINLWASWCLPCTHELTEMAAHELSLRDVDLQIIALNVDGGGQAAVATAAAEQVVRRIAFPFAAGVASQELMNKLEVLVYAMCVTQKPIPIPTSLLIDRKGRLAVVYRGEVSMEQLLSDIRLLDTDEDQLRTAALPFPGREHDVSNLLNLAMVASRFAEDGFVEDAASYLSAYEQQIAKGKERAGHPLHYKAHYNLAVAFSERGNFDKAVSHYERATKLNPKYVTALFNLAVLLANHDQDDRAIGIYRDVLRFDPHFVKAHNNLGLLLGKRGRSTEAEKQFRQALKVAPRSLDVRNNLGNLLVRTARISEAVEQLRQGLEVDPRDANTNYNLGVAFAKQRDFASAARHFRTATETDPQNVLAHHNLSLSLLAMGNVEEAHVFAQKAVSLDSSYQPARKVLTRILTLLDESAHK
jgi:tetratricopeptide (TPR) repeat protein